MVIEGESDMSQGNLDSMLGIAPIEEIEVGWLTLPAAKCPITESNFSWPMECPFGQAEGRTLYAVSGVRGCPNGCTYCWMRQFWVKSTRPRLPEGTRYEDPVVLTDLVRQFDAQLRSRPKMKGQWLLVSNTTDPLAQPALEVFPELAGLALLRSMNLVILSKSAPPFDVAVPPLLERSILKSEGQIWWGATVTTDDDAIARYIEPHSPPPSRRLKLLNAVQSWAQVQGISDRLKTWVSVGGWHTGTDMMPLMEALASVRVELVVIELMHKQKSCEIEWKDWLVREKDIDSSILESVIKIGAEKGISVVFKDELRRRVNSFGKLRKLYEEMHPGVIWRMKK